MVLYIKVTLKFGKISEGDIFTLEHCTLRHASFSGSFCCKSESVTEGSACCTYVSRVVTHSQSFLAILGSSDTYYPACVCAKRG